MAIQELLRFSVGLEAYEDLVADFKQAFESIAASTASRL